MGGRLRTDLGELMLIPGLSGHEGRVRRHIATALAGIGLSTSTDRLGNLIATIAGSGKGPSVMLFTHMDQLGLVVRKIEASGLVRVERLGGVPEKALPAQAVLFSIGEGRDVPGLIANKSHHATTPEEKFRVLPYSELYVDAGFDSADAVRAAGIDIGTPVVYAPRFVELASGRVAGTSVDDRAGCAVLLEMARRFKAKPPATTVHLVFSVQEEFNLRGAVTAAQALAPDVAVQIDLILATDTPDMAGRGDVTLGGGPAMSLYSFHGRGTLNGTIPHPALVRLFAETARREATAVAAERACRRADQFVLCAAGQRRRRRDRPRLPLALYAFLAGSLRSFGSRATGPTARRRPPADRQELQPRPRRFRTMSCYLGIDIGTFESKGVLVDGDGVVLAMAAKPHKMLVPQPGWAEHRPREDWWGDFTHISRKLIADAGIQPGEIRAVGASAIGPCMLPVDGDGEALMNGVLYGVDARAAAEIDELTAAIGVDVLLDRCGNALTSQSVGPKILWLKRNRPEIFAKTHKVLTSTSYLVHRLTGAFVIDHYTAANFSPLYLADELAYSDSLAPTSFRSSDCPMSLGRPTSPAQ